MRRPQAPAVNYGMRGSNGTEGRKPLQNIKNFVASSLVNLQQQGLKNSLSNIQKSGLFEKSLLTSSVSNESHARDSLFFDKENFRGDEGF
jgi:hypothetical protein